MSISIKIAKTKTLKDYVVEHPESWDEEKLNHFVFRTEPTKATVSNNEPCYSSLIAPKIFELRSVISQHKRMQFQSPKEQRKLRRYFNWIL